MNLQNILEQLKDVYLGDIHAFRSEGVTSVLFRWQSRGYIRVSLLTGAVWTQLDDGNWIMDCWRVRL